MKWKDVTLRNAIDTILAYHLICAAIMRNGNQIDIDRKIAEMEDDLRNEMKTNNWTIRELCKAHGTNLNMLRD